MLSVSVNMYGFVRVGVFYDCAFVQAIFSAVNRPVAQ